jgi:FkbM family methyltransferase
LKLFEAIPDIDLYNMYGPTETTIWSTTARLDPCRVGAITIGTPIANTQIYILDQRYQPVPIGVPGDLYIGGMGVTRGYFNQPDLTAARFLPDPFASRSGQRLYKTGDIARFLPDGSIEYLERADQQVKIRGYRIELGEIEALLEQHPAVQSCVVRAVQDHAGDMQLIAYLVPTRQQSLLLEEKERVLADHQSYLLPNGLIVAHFSDHQTRALYREIFEDQEYFRHNITLKDGDCVFDVGANIGMFSLYIHQRYANLDVYAFEPLPPIFEILQTNMALYQANVTCLPYGLSDKNEQTQLIFYPDMPGLSGRYSNPEEDKQTARSMLLESVAHEKMTERDQARLQQEATEIAEQHYRSQTFQCQMKTLSDIIKQYHIQQIDLLKVDVEKSELQVLLGIAEEDWPRIKQLVMEIHNTTLLDAVYSLLAQHGYIIHVDELPLGKASRQLSDMHVYLLYAIHPSRDAGSSSQRILATPTSALLSRNDLQRYLEAYLPNYMVPSAFIVLDALPRTPNNKVDRKALPAPDERLLLTHPSDERFVSPLTPLEEELAQMWSALLRGQRVGRHDNFFRIGGHSLVAMQLIARINAVYQIELPLSTLFQNPSIAQLADAITRSKMEQYSPEELTALLTTIDQMSEEEARSLLDE